MIRREIQLDEESDQILTGLAAEHEGDLGKALTELLHSRQAVEAFLEQCEAAQLDSLHRIIHIRDGKVEKDEQVK